MDHTARIWRAEAGHGAPMALAHDGQVHDIRFSRDGAWLITASLDKTARIWSKRRKSLGGSSSCRDTRRR